MLFVSVGPLLCLYPLQIFSLQNGQGRYLPIIHNYHIPLSIYGPKIINRGINKTLASQIDVAPTIVGLLGWSYKSKFFGSDILREGFQPRAFIGNYQKLGYLKWKILTVLSPKRKVSQYKITREGHSFSDVAPIHPDQKSIKEAVSYYQSASFLYKHELTQYRGPRGEY